MFSHMYIIKIILNQLLYKLWQGVRVIFKCYVKGGEERKREDKERGGERGRDRECRKRGREKGVGGYGKGGRSGTVGESGRYDVIIIRK